MFGYVIANYRALTEEQKRRYRACYCGVCRALQERAGIAGRFTLTYDMSFLVLLLTSLYEPEEGAGRKCCMAHPLRKQDYLQSELVAYAADMNIALAYHNCLDDWKDDRSLLGLGETKLIKRAYEQVKSFYPRQCCAIEDGIRRLSAVESAADSNMDAAADCFGDIMAEVFVYKTDRWEHCLREMAHALGKFIYLMDACEDLPSDLRHGRYNPLIGPEGVGQTLTECEALLSAMMADCTRHFEKLPLVKDAEILRNVLYSGVWTKYNALKKKRGSKSEQEGEDDGGSV